jgi:hypothetical protein
MLTLSCAWAQETSATDPAAAATNSAATPNPAEATVPRLVKFNGVLMDAADKPLTGPVEVTFSIYKSQTDLEPLWQETQTVEAGAGGQYTALLGAMSEPGLPVELFASGEARWLGVTAGKLAEQPRLLLVSVPYALKAGDAATLGGKPASAFVQAGGPGTSVETGGASGAAMGVEEAGTTGASASGAKKTKASPEQTTTSPVVTPGGTANYLSKFSAAATIVNSALFESGGKVGIGTATPASPLTVTTGGAPLPTIGTTPILATFGSPSGTVPWALKQNAAASATPSLMWFETADGNLGWIGAGGTATMAMGGLSGNALALYSNSTRRMFFDTSGHVGIGTWTPAYTLDVAGTGRFTGAVTFGTPVTFASGQTFPIPAGGVTNAMLANSSLTVTAGSGLSGGGSVSLGGTTTLSLNPNVSGSTAAFSGSTSPVVSGTNTANSSFGQLGTTVTFGSGTFAAGVYGSSGATGGTGVYGSGAAGVSDFSSTGSGVDGQTGAASAAPASPAPTGLMVATANWARALVARR